jgi:hypothetical protein
MSNLIGKTILVYEEWYSGKVFYIDIYLDKSGKLFAKRKVYYNTYSKKIEREQENQGVFAPLGYKICEFDDITYQI